MRAGDKLDYYVDAHGKHRWRIKARNGRVIDASSQGFASKAGAARNMRRVLGIPAKASAT